MGQTALLRAHVNSLEESRKKLAQLSSRLPGVETETNRWLTALPLSEEEVSFFAASLEGVAKEKGLTISLDLEDFPKQVDIGGKMLPGLGLIITLEGSFDGVRSFLTDLVGLNYFFKTDKLTILAHETKPGVKAAINGSLMTSLTP